jgi:hypothetical protein
MTAPLRELPLKLWRLERSGAADCRPARSGQFRPLAFTFTPPLGRQLRCESSPSAGPWPEGRTRLARGGSIVLETTTPIDLFNVCDTHLFCIPVQFPTPAAGWGHERAGCSA